MKSLDKKKIFILGKEPKSNGIVSEKIDYVYFKKKTKELGKRVKLFIEAWYIRTLECIDMDNGDRVIPPPTKKEWELGVKKDLNKLLTQQRTELLEEIKVLRHKDNLNPFMPRTRIDIYNQAIEDVINLLNKKYE